MERVLVEPMEFNKIDKVSDELCAIGPNVILKFNVSLSKTSNGKRYHFHKEYEYPSRGITEQPTLVTIKRSFDFYLSIESMQKDSKGYKIFIRIGAAEYMKVKQSLETAISWFTDKKYEKLFAYDKDKRIILMNPIPEIEIPNLPMNTYIKMYPIVIERGTTAADQEPGIRMELDSPYTYVDMKLDKLMEIYYFISRIDMYQAALSIVNYVQRPDFGTNRFVMEPQHTLKISSSKTGVSGIEGRFVTPKDAKGNINVLEG